MARSLGIESTSHIIAENGGVIYDWRKMKIHYKNPDGEKVRKHKEKILSEIKGNKFAEEAKETIVTIFMEDLDKTPALAKRITKALNDPDLAIKHYKDGAIDVFHSKVNKGKALEYYFKNLTESSDAQVFTFGDGVNDLEMLEFGTPVTFADAHPEVIRAVKNRNGLVSEKDGPDGAVEALSNLSSDGLLPEAFNHIGFAYRPWGSWEVLSTGDGFKVKKMVVKPGLKLSLQKHKHRSEHWFVFEGTATVTLNGSTLKINHGNDIYIRKEAIHRVSNRGKSDLVIIEVQRGKYLGEDDIVKIKE
jgi:mannose-6-phosphate isomerase-like protein (cupin superfamily)/predicted mannosyl-3-phosphoglycerate phosphatase (HAD superfamily)